MPLSTAPSWPLFGSLGRKVVVVCCLPTTRSLVANGEFGKSLPHPFRRLLLEHHAS